jgi:hypothetical protein
LAAEKLREVHEITRSRSAARRCGCG